MGSCMVLVGHFPFSGYFIVVCCECSRCVCPAGPGEHSAFAFQLMSSLEGCILQHAAAFGSAFLLAACCKCVFFSAPVGFR